MKTIQLTRLDSLSKQNLEEAFKSANRFWHSEKMEMHLDFHPTSPTHILWNYKGKEYSIQMAIEGLLFQTALLINPPIAMSFNRTLRFKDMSKFVDDPSISPDARNSLFVNNNGGRQTIEFMSALLVHELVHSRQEIDTPFGRFGFAIAYIFTLGIPWEKEAYAISDKACQYYLQE